MTVLRYGAAALVALPLFSQAAAQTIALNHEDATVWAQAQTVSGTLADAGAGTLYVNGEAVAFTAAGDGTFAVPLRLTEPETEIVACAGSPEVCTETLRYTLGYEPRPEAELRPFVSGRTVRLEGHVLANPDAAELAFEWAEDDGNPAALGLSVLDDSTAEASVPADAPPGEYYFDWTVTASDGDARRARTFVTVEEDGDVRPFVMETDHAAWIDRATVYEIAPRLFANQFNGRFEHITQKLPEIAALGVSAVWLQPIYPNANGGQAYDVTDYFGIWPELGDEEDLRELVETAHGLGLKVMLDFVPNHSSIEHPYAQDAIAHGPRSHYYDFYQRTFDDAPYSQHYNTLHEGEMTFVYYFWEDLVNFDYDNPEVQRHMIEASRYWVEEFDIDGYRFDAVWAPVARKPGFFDEWRAALKRVKPELFWLAESKATDPETFGTDPPGSRFDAAYDWTPSQSYISQWAWQRGAQSQTLFNTGAESLRAQALRNALTNRGDGFPEDAVVFRYLENNDTPRFFANHSEAQTRMAAALLFSLPGIPMLYYGQEIAVRSQFPSFPTSVPIASYDTRGFVPYYRHLLALRRTFPALYGVALEEVAVGPAEVADQTFAYRRWAGDEHIVGAINMGDEPVAATLSLPVEAMGIEPATMYYLTDLLSGDVRPVVGAELVTVAMEIPAHTTRLWAVADSVVVLPVINEQHAASPSAMAIHGTYPNPARDRITVTFSTAHAGAVQLRLLDVLGRLVRELGERAISSGRYEEVLDVSELPTGVYVLQLEGPSGTDAYRIAVIK